MKRIVPVGILGVWLSCGLGVPMDHAQEIPKDLPQNQSVPSRFGSEVPHFGEASIPLSRYLDSVLCIGYPRPRWSSQSPSKVPTKKIGNFTHLPIPPYQQGVVALESLHGARPVIYLDFAGGYTASWGGITYARPDMDNAQIAEVWSRVAEDFLPFNINVTTDLRAYQNAPQGGRQRVIITPTDVAAPEEGGAAYIGSFNWAGETPCWVFVLSPKPCAEACSHEVGHTLGLSHDGQLIDGTNDVYYAGHGTGLADWAPIMGISFFRNITQWSKGEYAYANNNFDQLNLITTLNNGVTYRPDDTGDTLADSRYLEVFADYSARAEGIIESTDDTDAFQFTTSGGLVSLRADPQSLGPNLAVQVALCDASENILATNNPQDVLWASITTNLPSGTYTFKVTGAGRHDPLTNGFSSYGSLGYYSVSGAIANARLPDRFAIPEHSPDGTVVGRVAPKVANGDVFYFTIRSGNAGNTFAIDPSGTITVADNSLLDFNTLAAQTQFAVQFELFVDITDLQDASLTETNRRVVVAITPLPPVIVVQPQDTSVPAGTTASLSVTAQSTSPLSYQWFFNEVALPGAYDSTLFITNAQTWNAGQYSVSVVGWFSSITSQVASLKITPTPPVLVQQPQSQGAFPGFGATFNCAARGSEPMSYQWQLNGSDIAGATQATLSLTNLSPDQAAVYTVVVSNSVGNVISDQALLAMVPVAAWGWDNFGQAELSIQLTNAVQVAAGADFNLAIKRDSTVLAWGRTNRALIPTFLSNVVAVAAGTTHALALRSYGTIFGWGDNSAGQLNPPSSAKPIVAIAAGDNRSLALNSAGQVLAWGLGTNGSNIMPQGLTNFVAIASGSNHCLALRASGEVITWGDNFYGQTNIPTGVSNIVAIAAGGSHSLALTKDGTVIAWGNNANGQTSIPSLLSSVVAISAGSFNSLALKSDGTVVAWGAGSSSGAAQFPNLGQSIVPGTVTNVAQISGGIAHTLALVANGAPFITSPAVDRFSVTGPRLFFRATATGSFPLSYQWQLMGNDIPGATNQLFILDRATDPDSGLYSVVVSNAFGVASAAQGRLTVTSAPYFVTQPQDLNVWIGGSGSLWAQADGLQPLYYQWWFNGAPLLGATNSSLTFDHVTPNEGGQYSLTISNSSAVISSRKVRLNVSQVAAWGLGTNAQDSSFDYGQTTVPDGVTEVVQVAAGMYHSLALKNDGTVVAWGAGSGQPSPARISEDFGQSIVPAGLIHVVAIAAGGYHSLALTDQGKVFAWGAGTTNLHFAPHYGQCIVPTSLGPVIAIAAGDYHSVAVTQDGRVVVWGGQGFGPLNPTNVPASLSNVVSIAARGNNTVALRSDNVLINWPAAVPIVTFANAVQIAAPYAYYLALRVDGTIASGGFLNPPPGLRDLQEIAAGYYHALGIRSNGTVVTWGQTNAHHLAAIPLGLSNVVDIAGGMYHSLALLGDGSPFIRNQPTDREVFLGTRTALLVGAAGLQPLGYQWFFNGKRVTGATSARLDLSNVQVANAGSYQVVVTNPMSAGVTSRVVSLSVVLPIGPALNAQQLAWTSGGGPTWFGQTNITHDGVLAAQSGAINGNQQSSLQTKIVGPGSLRFWWKVSSEQWFDTLSFSIDNSVQAQISGEVDWQQLIFDIPDGNHTINWTYSKDATFSGGKDCGWVDQVQYTPNPPSFTTQPISQVVQAGQRVLLNVAATGPPPLSFQWLKNGANLPGATSTQLLFANADRLDSGTYAVVVSTIAASIRSSNAVIQVISPTVLSMPLWMPDGTLQIGSTDFMKIPLGFSEVQNFTAEVSTNLVDWTPLGTQFWWINGNLILNDWDATNHPRRFYRIVERLPAGP